jgi:hypothetical protein
MSHSQFHSTNLFILRHAWLNLWDKHMTTGRINQVTTVPSTHAQQRTPVELPRERSTLSTRSRSSLSNRIKRPFNDTSNTQQFGRYPASPSTVAYSHRTFSTLFPDLTYFKRISPCPNQRTKIVAFSEDYQRPAKTQLRLRAVTADPRVVNWLTGLAIGNKSTPFTHRKHWLEKTSVLDFNRHERSQQSPNYLAMHLSKPVHPDGAGTSIARSRRSQSHYWHTWPRCTDL